MINECFLCSRTGDLRSIEENSEAIKLCGKSISHVICANKIVEPSLSKDLHLYKICGSCFYINLRWYRYTKTVNNTKAYTQYKILQNNARNVKDGNIKTKLPRSDSIRNLHKEYPNLKLPKECIGSDLNPYIKVHREDVTQYFKEYEKLKPSLLRKEEIPDKKSDICITNVQKDSNQVSQSDPVPKLTLKNIADEQNIEVDTSEEFLRTLSLCKTDNTTNIKIYRKRKLSCHSNEPLSKKVNDQQLKSDNLEKENNEPLLNEKYNRSLYTCITCNTNFTCTSNLRHHQKKHMKCSLCKKRFLTLEDTKDHIENNCEIKKIMDNPPIIKLFPVECVTSIREKYPKAFGDAQIDTVKIINSPMEIIYDNDIVCISDDEEPQTIIPEERQDIKSVIEPRIKISDYDNTLIDTSKSDIDLLKKCLKLYKEEVTQTNMPCNSDITSRYEKDRIFKINGLMRELEFYKVLVKLQHAPLYAIKLNYDRSSVRDESIKSFKKQNLSVKPAETDSVNNPKKTVDKNLSMPVISLLESNEQSSVRDKSTKSSDIKQDAIGKSSTHPINNNTSFANTNNLQSNQQNVSMPSLSPLQNNKRPTVQEISTKSFEIKEDTLLKLLTCPNGSVNKTGLDTNNVQSHPKDLSMPILVSSEQSNNKQKPKTVSRSEARIPATHPSLNNKAPNACVNNIVKISNSSTTLQNAQYLNSISAPTAANNPKYSHGQPTESKLIHNIKSHPSRLLYKPERQSRSQTSSSIDKMYGSLTTNAQAVVSNETQTFNPSCNKSLLQSNNTIPSMPNNASPTTSFSSNQAYYYSNNVVPYHVGSNNNGNICIPNQQSRYIPQNHRIINQIVYQTISPNFPIFQTATNPVVTDVRNCQNPAFTPSIRVKNVNDLK